MRPLVLAVTNFLSPADCDYIQTHAGPHVIKSDVSRMDHDHGKAAANWRTSSTHFLPSHGHPPLQSTVWLEYEKWRAGEDGRGTKRRPART